MGAMFLDLLNATISVTWLVAAVLLIRFCLQKAPKYIRCLLWGIVALRLLLPFSIKSALSLLPTSQTIPDEIVYATIPSVNTGIFSVDMTINPVIGQALAPQTGASVNPVQLLLEIGGYVWLVGLTVMLIYAFVSYLLVRRSVRISVPLQANIRLCDHISTPFILGILRPYIYVPSSMNESDRAYVIAHEQAHLARRDHWWKPLGFVLLSAHWFNPFLWLAYILLCRDIELACDEKVIAACGEEQKKPYADALINCSAPRKRIAACPLAFGENSVKGRIKSVLHYKKPAFWIVVAAFLSCIAVAICFLTDPKDKWESSNYGIVSTVSGAEHESVGFHYLEGTINAEDPLIVVNWKNNTDQELCYTEQFTLYRGEEPCPTLEAPRWKAILKCLSPQGEIPQTYSLAAYDLSQNGSYRLETEFYFKSNPQTKYVAYVNFLIDRMYSFVGWQYAGEGVIYGNDKVPNAKYTDGTVPNVYITDDSVYLLMAENGQWKEIGALMQDKLDRTRFDYALNEDWWDAGYSAKLLRQNNKHTVSYINADANESYYLLEQKNGEIYLAIGRLSKIDWIFRLTPVGTTLLLSRPTSPPTGPATVPNWGDGNCIINTQMLGGSESISFSFVGCEEKDGRLLARIRWKNHTDKTLEFGPQFALWQNGKQIFPPEGFGWDTVLYSIAPNETFEEMLDISACVLKGKYELKKTFRFFQGDNASLTFPVVVSFTLTNTRNTTNVPQTPTTQVSKPAQTPTPSFSATVLQVTDNEMLVEIDAVEAGPDIRGQAWISTNVKWSHPVPQLTVGMKIDVLYDGVVQETYPLQIPTVYTLCDCAYKSH